MPDYESALNYIMWGQWDDLFTLMIRTNDDILEKRIRLFLHAYYYSSKKGEIEDAHDYLVYYIDHALQSTPVVTM